MRRRAVGRRALEVLVPMASLVLAGCADTEPEEVTALQTSTSAATAQDLQAEPETDTVPPGGSLPAVGVTGCVVPVGMSCGDLVLADLDGDGVDDAIMTYGALPAGNSPGEAVTNLSLAVRLATGELFEAFVSAGDDRVSPSMEPTILDQRDSDGDGLTDTIDVEYDGASDSRYIKTYHFDGQGLTEVGEYDLSD